MAGAPMSFAADPYRVIYEELVRVRAEPASRQAYLDVIARMVERGADAVILGCTDIMLLLRPEDSLVPLCDNASIRAEAADDLTLGDCATRRLVALGGEQ